MVNVGAQSSFEDDLAGLPEQKPPVDETTLAHGRVSTNTSPANQLQTIFHQQALQQIQTHAHSNTASELGGVLLGHAYQHEQTTYVEILAAIPAHSTEHGPVHFTFTAEAWAQLHQQREREYPDLRIVGWFHTHPNLTVFYSADDVVVHTVAFTMPWHIGLVVDPVRHEAALFGWVRNPHLPEGREILPLPGFYELPTDQPTSRIDWQYKYRRTLDDMLTAAYTTYGTTLHLYQAGQTPSPTTEIAHALGMTPAQLKTGLTLTSILLLILLALGGYFTLYQRTQNANQAIQILASERLQLATAAGVANCPDPNVQLILPVPGRGQWVNSQIPLFGIANHPTTHYYDIYAYQENNPTRYSITTLRWRTKLGSLGTWDTTGFPPGIYDLSLQPKQSNGIPLNEATCTIRVALVAR
jgi:proteasome lid subunit RPN8/RPN11